MLTDLELKKAAQEEIAALPDDQKVVLSLYYADGLTFPEISQVLEVPESYVRRLYVRAATKVFS